MKKYTKDPFGPIMFVIFMFFIMLLYAIIFYSHNKNDCYRTIKYNCIAKQMENGKDSKWSRKYCIAKARANLKKCINGEK